jgi:hypothetical protein
MRTLYIIPIVHSAADMGSMAKELEKKGIEKLGREKWEENQRLITQFWDQAEKELDALKLKYNNVRIYQDGLPAGGEIGMKIVTQTAAKGSRNYQIVQKLIEKGAMLEKTESKELLIKEYQFVQAFVQAPADKKDQALRVYEQAKDDLIKERDAYIAKQIDTSLKDGETGILFIGAHHKVKEKLPKSVTIKALK